MGTPLNITLRSHAPELAGRPTLSEFLCRETEANNVSTEIAGRLLAAGVERIVTHQVSDLLNGAIDLSPRLPGFDTIAPLVRVVADFSAGQVVHYQTPAKKAAEWGSDAVWGLVEPETEVDKDGLDLWPRGGIILRHRQNFEHIIGPDWPALLDQKFFDALDSRSRDHHRSALTGAGRLFFELSFFDDGPNGDANRVAAAHGLRRIRLGFPPNMPRTS